MRIGGVRSGHRLDAVWRQHLSAGLDLLQPELRNMRGTRRELSQYEVRNGDRLRHSSLQGRRSVLQRELWDLRADGWRLSDDTL